MMEYFCSKDKQIAFKIFELGLKLFSDDPVYICRYLDHLIATNEDSSTYFDAPSDLSCFIPCPSFLFLLPFLIGFATFIFSFVYFTPLTTFIF